MRTAHTITLVIPLFNEEDRVISLLKSLENFNFPKEIKLEKVRFVDDGSVDGTPLVLNSWKKKVGEKVEYDIEIISYKRNKGRGCAVRRGLSKITTDYGVYLDGDLDIPFLNLCSLVEQMNEGVDVIMGSKKLPGSVCTTKRKFHRMMMGYGHSVFAGLILGKFYWDYQGGFKAFSRKSLKAILPILSINRWGFDMEAVYWSRKLGFSVREIPLVWGSMTDESKVKAVEDSIRAIVDMVGIRTRGELWSLETSELPKFAKMGVKTMTGLIISGLSLFMMILGGRYEA